MSTPHMLYMYMCMYMYMYNMYMSVSKTQACDYTAQLELHNKYHQVFHKTVSLFKMIE